MVSDIKLGKSVRACDNCGRKGARWYCTADDAFLCESCDSSVHNANPLANRHERVPLRNDDESEEEGNKASWHHGFTRKARTPRHKKHINPLRMVPEPEIGSEEESDEHLLYRVPVINKTTSTVENNKSNAFANHFVESLLDDDMEGLGILDCFPSGMIIKDEDEEEIGDLGRDIFDLNFDYISENKIQNETELLILRKEEDDSNKALLKLDYERVISAWDDNKSPWTTGEKPELSSSHTWWPADCSLQQGTMQAYEGRSGQVVGDGGREARVSRYREKRRTRLFSKKIRYEVRKLNAEKRPRMKGRFVKRPTPSVFPLLS